MGIELEFDENIWLERELIEREAFISQNLLPTAYEMIDFIESAIPTMFVCVSGKNYLLKKEEPIAHETMECLESAFGAVDAEMFY